VKATFVNQLVELAEGWASSGSDDDRCRGALSDRTRRFAAVSPVQCWRPVPAETCEGHDRMPHPRAIRAIRSVLRPDREPHGLFLLWIRPMAEPTDSLIVGFNGLHQIRPLARAVDRQAGMQTAQAGMLTARTPCWATTSFGARTSYANETFHRVGVRSQGWPADSESNGKSEQTSSQGETLVGGGRH
jgi:hypothetical protein